MSEDKVFEDSIQGIREYQEEVMKMSDDELYEYVFDQEYDSEDFESILLANRGIDLGKVLRAVLKNDPDAIHRVRYTDYEDGFWALPVQLTKQRIVNIQPAFKKHGLLNGEPQTKSQIVDGRKGYLSRFVYCPYCGEKLNWKQVLSTCR